MERTSKWDSSGAPVLLNIQTDPIVSWGAGCSLPQNYQLLLIALLVLSGVVYTHMMGRLRVDISGLMQIFIID